MQRLRSLPFLLCFGLARSPTPSPLFESTILYGQMLSSPWTPLPSNSPELVEIVEMVTANGLRRGDSSIVFDETGNKPASPTITDPRKMKLHWTRDGRTSAYTLVTDRTSDGGQLTRQKRLVIFGLLYALTLLWPTPDGVHVHNIVATKDREKAFHIYQHTYYFDKDKSVGGGEECSDDVDQDSGLLSKLFKKGADHDTLSLATYNLWNFNSYEDGIRLRQFGKLCRSSNADIFGFQEVRYDFSQRNYKGPSQVHHLELELQQYQYVYQPAMLYPVEKFGRVEEGVAIFSRYPIVNHSYILLPRNSKDSADFHQRICLHAEVKTPMLGSVHVYVTHLSLSERSRLTSVIEIGNFMKMHSGPKVLMGDMNAEPHSDSIRYLTGKISINGTKMKGLVDAWTTLHAEPRPGAPGAYRENEPRDHGLTFSTLEDNLVKRIDFILVDLDGKASIEEVDLLDDGVRYDEVASDHLGVKATLTVLSPR